MERDALGILASNAQPPQLQRAMQIGGAAVSSPPASFVVGTVPQGGSFYAGMPMPQGYGPAMPPPGSFNNPGQPGAFPQGFPQMMMGALPPQFAAMMNPANWFQRQQQQQQVAVAGPQSAARTTDDSDSLDEPVFANRVGAGRRAGDDSDSDSEGEGAAEADGAAEGDAEGDAEAASPPPIVEEEPDDPDADKALDLGPMLFGRQEIFYLP